MWCSGIDRHAFDALLDRVKEKVGAKTDAEVPTDALEISWRSSKRLIEERTGRPFPQDPVEQLRLAINAVFDSWWAKKAVDYRRIHRLSDDWGTAVTVMAMVFGNLGTTSGTGVCFSRDPASGERRFFGEFLVNAQGEDVVAGIRTPEHLDDLERRMPKVYAQLVAIKDKLEHHYRDMQDIEFTVQDGRLYILQTRSGKRTGAAAVRIAVEMVKEGLLDDRAIKNPEPRRAAAIHTALLRVEPGSLNQLLVQTVDPRTKLHGHRPGACRDGGRRRGQGRLRPGAGGRDGAARREGHPGARGDVPGGCGRDARRGGHPHVARGTHLARGGGGARDGGSAASWAPGTWWWTRSNHLFRAGKSVVREGQVITLNGATGEVDRRAPCRSWTRSCPRTSGSCSAGPAKSPRPRSAPTRTRRRTPGKRASSRRTASGSCGRSTCSSGRTGS